MKVNENLAVVGSKVILVPYRREHVQRYHEWMSDPELRELTASEPLSLEEEYDMQRKWQEDGDKLTFIILARTRTGVESSPVPSATEALLSASLDPTRMIGDVNLFFKGNSANDDDFEVEVEIMIAEKSYHRQGYAREALHLLLSFATTYVPGGPAADERTVSPLPVRAERLVARIGEANTSSVRLFERSGFVVTKHVEIFRELEMHLGDVNACKAWAQGQVISLH